MLGAGKGERGKPWGQCRWQLPATLTEPEQAAWQDAEHVRLPGWCGLSQAEASHAGLACLGGCIMGAPTEDEPGLLDLGCPPGLSFHCRRIRGHCEWHSNSVPFPNPSV